MQRLGRGSNKNKKKRCFEPLRGTARIDLVAIALRGKLLGRAAERRIQSGMKYVIDTSFPVRARRASMNDSFVSVS